ncbi:MAG TPA: LysM domain-containing protein [Candidatus Methylacidiphilales bacterium]|jgi:nucleoid-associated protein YgaU|nr:LysM domain-containing protein [Candidatus Methylacidiphilales bacterium]
MIHRSLRISSIVVVTLSLAALPSLSFAQATNAPAAPAPAPVAPEAAPAPAPAETTAPDASTSPRPATYTLQAGDTLESVGKQWGLTGRQLQKYNHFTNSQVRRLQIGTVIKVPPAKSTSK